jgi:hypothetical protein
VESSRRSSLRHQGRSRLHTQSKERLAIAGNLNHPMDCVLPSEATLLFNANQLSPGARCRGFLLSRQATMGTLTSQSV